MPKASSSWMPCRELDFDLAAIAEVVASRFGRAFVAAGLRRTRPGRRRRLRENPRLRRRLRRRPLDGRRSDQRLCSVASQSRCHCSLALPHVRTNRLLLASTPHCVTNSVVTPFNLEAAKRGPHQQASNHRKIQWPEMTPKSSSSPKRRFLIRSLKVSMVVVRRRRACWSYLVRQAT